MEATNKIEDLHKITRDLQEKKEQLLKMHDQEEDRRQILLEYTSQINDLNT